jgi:hypothetical protein
MEPALDLRADDAMDAVSRAKRSSGTGPALAPNAIEGGEALAFMVTA